MNCIAELARKRGEPYELTRVAYHEAGHLLAHIRLGVESGVTSIVADLEVGRLGYSEGEDTVFWGRVDEEFETGKRHAWGVSFMAGYAALIVAGETHDEAIVGAENDLDNAGNLGDIDAFKAEAIGLLREHSNQTALMLLAEQLLIHKTIGPLYAEEIVSAADGESTMDDILEAISLQGEQFIRE